MSIDKEKLLSRELEVGLELHYDLLKFSQKLDVTSLKDLDLLEEANRLEMHFDNHIRRIGELGSLFKKNNFVGKYFHDLVIQVKVHQKKLDDKIQKLMSRPEKLSDPKTPARLVYIYELKRQYDRVHVKLSLLQASNYMAIPKPLWQFDGITQVPMDVILQKQFEREFLPKKVSLAHELGLKQSPILKHETADRQHAFLAHLISWKPRMVAGNFNAMFPSSKADREEFPAHKHNAYWKKVIDEKGPIK